MRRIELGYGLSITGELAGTVALVVYALSAGGAGLVAVYAASRTVAGMGVALVLTGITSRLRRDRLLRWITGLRMILLAAAALLAASGQPQAAVIAAGAASSALAGTYRPLQAAVLPWLVRTPAELARPGASPGAGGAGRCVLGRQLGHRVCDCGRASERQADRAGQARIMVDAGAQCVYVADSAGASAGQGGQ